MVSNWKRFVEIEQESEVTLESDTELISTGVYRVICRNMTPERERVLFNDQYCREI